MKKMAWTFATVAAMLLPHLSATAVQAQSAGTYISVTGSDSNISVDCPATSPCQSFDAALTVTAASGHIACLDTGLFNAYPFNITKSLTLDCHDKLVAPVPNATLACGSNAIVINAPGGTVTLRNINISTFTDSCATNGIAIEAASVVNIEDCLIENFPQSGISVTTSANAIVNVKNTTIRNVANGISLAPTSGAVNGSIDHTTIAKVTGDGITTSAGGVYFTVTNSLIVNAAGIGVNAGGPGNVLEIDSSSVSNNNTAFATSGGLIRISRNLIYDNNTNFSISGGTIATSGDNKVAVNGSTVPNGSITQQ